MQFSQVSGNQLNRHVTIEKSPEQRRGADPERRFLFFHAKRLRLADDICHCLAEHSLIRCHSKG